LQGKKKASPKSKKIQKILAIKYPKIPFLFKKMLWLFLKIAKKLNQLNFPAILRCLYNKLNMLILVILQWIRKFQRDIKTLFKKWRALRKSTKAIIQLLKSSLLIRTKKLKKPSSR